MYLLSQQERFRYGLHLPQCNGSNRDMTGARGQQTQCCRIRLHRASTMHTTPRYYECAATMMLVVTETSIYLKQNSTPATCARTFFHRLIYRSWPLSRTPALQYKRHMVAMMPRHSSSRHSSASSRIFPNLTDSTAVH